MRYMYMHILYLCLMMFRKIHLNDLSKDCCDFIKSLFDISEDDHMILLKFYNVIGFIHCFSNIQPSLIL